MADQRGKHTEHASSFSRSMAGLDESIMPK